MPCRAYTDIFGSLKIAGRVHGYKDYRKRHPFDELERIMNGHKVIHGSYMSHICVDLLRVKKNST